MAYQSTAAEQTKSVRTGSGTLRSLSATNVNTVTRYLWILDGVGATGVPASLIAGPIPVGPGELVAVDFAPDFIAFTTGLFLAASSTLGTFTASGSNDFMFHVEHSERGF